MRPMPQGFVQEIQIPQGASSHEIASLLQNQGIIKNAFAFRLILWWNHELNRLQAGTYKLQPGMTTTEVIQLISEGKAIQDTIRFTIPEGYTVEQIAARLDQLGLVNSKQFLTEADHGHFSSQLVDTIPSGVPLKHRLEGYLFPSTYEIYKKSTAHQIIQIMLDRMQSEITPDLIQKWKQEGLSPHEGLTVASLIEREAQVSTERPQIAKVILNRLTSHPPMMLQIDATVQYIVGQKQELTYQDLKRESPYNTYLHEGLPPGPIACPGDESIRASSQPADNSYLFYVTKKDGSGTHYFANTYAEQLQNEQLSLKNAHKGE